MNRLSLHPPVITGREVHFAWDLEPASDMYLRNGFYFRFPPQLDLAAVPEHTWWTVFVLCSHIQWPFLRPLEVHLPVTLPPGEAETWLRLIDMHVATFETYRDTDEFDRGVTLIEGPRRLEPEVANDNGRCALAFSAGKDSLAQLGLLQEVVGSTVLVSTTAPRLPNDGHTHPRRRQIFDAIEAVSGCPLVDVESNIREVINSRYGQAQGFPHPINPRGDPLIYSGALLAAGRAAGATHLFVAAENELSANTKIDGRYVQFDDVAYTALTQRTLNALLRSQGLSYGSLTSALQSHQVQKLLVKRYTKLRNLQYTCEAMTRSEAACSTCGECIHLALVILSAGESPASMGVDLVKMFNSMADWHPTAWPPPARSLPHREVSRRMHHSRVSALRTMSPYHVLCELQRRCGSEHLTREAWRAWRAFRRIRRETLALPYRPSGYRERFVELIDPLVRNRVCGIYREHFAPEPECQYVDSWNRLRQATAWVTEPIDGAASTSSQKTCFIGSAPEYVSS